VGFCDSSFSVNVIDKLAARMKCKLWTWPNLGGGDRPTGLTPWPHSKKHNAGRVQIFFIHPRRVAVSVAIPVGSGHEVNFWPGSSFALYSSSADLGQNSVL